MEESKFMLILALITFATSIYIIVTRGFTLYPAFLYMLGCIVALLSSITYNSKLLKEHLEQHKKTEYKSIFPNIKKE